jgi:hypothetical protein
VLVSGMRGVVIVERRIASRLRAGTGASKTPAQPPTLVQRQSRTAASRARSTARLFDFHLSRPQGVGPLSQVGAWEFLRLDVHYLGPGWRASATPRRQHAPSGWISSPRVDQPRVFPAQFVRDPLDSVVRDTKPLESATPRLFTGTTATEMRLKKSSGINTSSARFPGAASEAAS